MRFGIITLTKMLSEVNVEQVLFISLSLIVRGENMFNMLTIFSD